jgi:hypothetical protein
MTVPPCTATWKQGKQTRQKQMWSKPNEYARAHVCVKGKKRRNILKCEV